MRLPRRAVLSLLLPLQLGACTAWRTQPLTPAEVIARDHPERIRITTRAGRLYELHHPTVTGDTVAGKVGRDSIAIASNDVVIVESPRFDSSLFVGLGLVGLLVLALGGLLAFSDFHDNQ